MLIYNDSIGQLEITPEQWETHKVFLEPEGWYDPNAPKVVVPQDDLDNEDFTNVEQVRRGPGRPRKEV